MSILTSASLGSLFTVPKDDWTAISQRVGYSARLRNIAGTVAEYLPIFTALLAACDGWRDETFPAIVAASTRLHAYSVQAHDEFADIQATVAGGMLTPDVQDRVRHAIKQLADQTAALDEEFRKVATSVAAFSDVNRAADTEVDRFVARLGAQWRSILPSTRTVDDATGLVRGAWEALTADLGALVGQSFEVTVPFLLGLEIGSALLAWSNLKTEADAFGQLAPGQDKYLSGAWLG